jgi:outer membrane usher protein
MAELVFRWLRRFTVNMAVAALVGPWSACPAIAAEGGSAAPEKLISVPVSLMFGNIVLGEPEARFTESGQIRDLAGSRIRELLQPIVVPAVLAELKASETAAGFLPVSGFRDAGLEAEYDSRHLALRVFIPFELRTVAAVSIAARRPPTDGVPLKPPAATSAYVNLRAASDYRWKGIGESGRQSATLDFDGAFRFFDTVLEGTATYREQSLHPWSRGDVRLVKDFPDDINRLIFGDLAYSTAGFQNFEQAGGISFARNFDLQPYHVKSSTAERTFTLTRRSDVDVIVNGRRVRTITLEPGRYNLRDLPLASGTNDVAVRITDEVGRTETIRFPFVFDTNLLAEGEHDFSYALGARSETSPSGKNYETTDPVFSAFHALGADDHLTLGANLQAVERHRVIGAEARLGTVFGIFRGDLAFSHSSYAPTDIVARLQYRFTEPQTPETLNRNLLTSLTWRGESFLPLGSTEASNPASLDAGMVYGQELPDGWYGSIGASVQFDRSGDPDTRTYDVSVSRRLTDSLSLDIFGRRETRPGLGTETSALIAISWIPPQSRQRISVQRDTADRSTRVDWSYTPTQTVGGLQADIAAEKRPASGQEELRGDLTYTDYRYEVQVLHQEVRNNGAETESESALRLGTALVFAGGHMAVSRPVSDSFLLVAPHESLAASKIHVNEVSGHPRARTDSLGPAVLPQLPSYYVHRVTYDVPDLPQGYALGDQIFNVQPPYRSGTVIVAGSGASISVEGTLLDGGGAPIDLQLGSVVFLDSVEPETRRFFTDRTGRFQITGLAPGRYELRLQGADVHVRFAIPEGASGIRALGDIEFPTGGAQ